MGPLKMVCPVPKVLLFTQALQVHVVLLPADAGVWDK